MQITCLAENTSNNPSLSAEHGLSLYIEAKGKKILFDMGQSELFCVNAGKLGKDISDIDFAILSHGHYDHGGGIGAFFEKNKKAPVYINKDAFLPHYNSEGKYIGLDTSLSKNNRIIFTQNEHKIAEGLTLFTCNQFTKNYDIGTFGMTEERDGKIIPESFAHEQYLLIEEGGKRVLVSGCSHKGIIDITDWFKPDVLIGGFHFSKFPLDQRLTDYARLLDSFGTTYHTCHCTGKEQYEFMKNQVKSLYYLSTGDSITI